jgi:uncharacterized protein (DUF433 family)
MIYGYVYLIDGATMTTLQQAEQLLFEMSPTEKLHLLQLIARDLGGETPGVESTPGICGGEPRIAGTRIPVWVLVQFKKLGTTEAEILRAYPTLRAEDLTNAWAYYRANKTAIEEQILENETA